MYFEIQYTIADLRNLLADKRYSVIPQLESLYQGNNIGKKKLRFLRLIGNSKSRRSSHIPLEGESFRCMAKRTFRLPTFIKHELCLNNGQITLIRNHHPGLDRVYKGYFRNTFGVVNRFQWGFNFNVSDVKYHESINKSNLFSQLIEGLLQIPVEIPLVKDIKKPSKLNESLTTIIETSIIKKKQKKTFKEYLEETEPMIVFQLTATDLKYIDLPRNAEKIKTYDENNVILYKYEFQNDNCDYTIYFIVYTKTPDDLTEEKIRLLRSCLLRFFAEKECLIRVLDNAEKYLNTDKVKDYLNAPIFNNQATETLTTLGLNDKTCNYILSPANRNFIEDRWRKIVSIKAVDSSLGLLT